MNKRPNIIIFNPDEMRADAMSHLGNPAAMTPHLDAFARQDAVSFENAFCQNPVCVPSRCSFFTGLYPHVHGHRTMTYMLHPGETDLFSSLKRAGYHIWMNQRNDLYACQFPGWLESHCDEFFVPEGTSATKPVHPELRSDPGSPYYYSHFEGELGLDRQGKCYTSDDECVDAAIERIRSWKEKGQPLCIFLGLLYPHVPYNVEEPYYSTIDRSKLPPRIRPEDCTGKSRMMELYRQYQNLGGLTESQWDELRAVYLGMCTKVDAQFQRLCAALKEAGMYDDSAIFVLSDHGDFAGDYGMAEKAQNCFEDCLTRVPLLIKPPKGVALDAGVTSSMAELVDFYATALDFAHVESPHDHFGRSLRPILADRTAAVREFVCCEGGRLPGETQCDEYHQPGGRIASPDDVYWPKKRAQFDDAAHAKATMLRTKDYKYISRIQGEDELYDLNCDPHETTNRIHDPALASVKTELQYDLMKWLQKTADIVPREYDQRMTPDMLWGIVRTSCPAGYEEDVKKKLHQGMSIGAAFAYCASLRHAK